MGKKKNYIIKCEDGLHARPASELVQMAQRYNCSITITCPKENMYADAKSILGVLSLGADKGTNIILEADGDDAEQALFEIIELLDSI